MAEQLLADDGECDPDNLLRIRLRIGSDRNDGVSRRERVILVRT